MAFRCHPGTACTVHRNLCVRQRCFKAGRWRSHRCPCTAPQASISSMGAAFWIALRHPASPREPKVGLSKIILLRSAASGCNIFLQLPPVRMDQAVFHRKIDTLLRLKIRFIVRIPRIKNLSFKIFDFFDHPQNDCLCLRAPRAPSINHSAYRQQQAFCS